MQHLRDLEDKIKKQEAEKRRLADEREAAYQKESRALQVQSTLEALAVLGFEEVYEDELRGDKLNAVHIGDWQIAFGTTHKQLAGFKDKGHVRCTSLYHSVSRFGNTTDMSQDHHVDFEAYFRYLPSFEQKLREQFPKAYLVADEYAKLNHYDKVKPISEFQGFDMKFTVSSSEMKLSEEDQMKLAKEILDTEKQYQDQVQSLPAWIEKHEIKIQARKDEIAEYQRQADEEQKRRDEEFAARQKAREEKAETRQSVVIYDNNPLYPFIVMLLDMQEHVNHDC